jgi:uncharacterized protein (TIGR00288 family)
MLTHPSLHRVALLIDADNASSQTLEQMLTIARSCGEITIKRAYGNWDGPELTQWKSMLPLHGIQAMHQFDYVKGKNATDMAMTIDAMDLLYGQCVDVFVVASSDSDFTPLAHRIRASGKQVIGLGKAEACCAFRQACTRFHDVKIPGLLEGFGATAPAAPKVECNPPDPLLMLTLRQLIMRLAGPNGQTELGALGKALRGSGHKPQDFGYSSLLKLLSSVEGFTLSNQGSHYQVSVH